MDFGFLLILALAFGVMWLMTSRTRKQQKEAANFRAHLAPGQEVMTGSGLFATIVAVDDDVITLETSPGVTSRWLRPAIAKLVDPPVADDDEPDEEYEEYDDETDDDGAPAGVGGASPLSLTKRDDALEVPDDASSLTRGTDPDDDPRR